MRACVRACVRAAVRDKTVATRCKATVRMAGGVSSDFCSAGNGHPGPFKEDELDSKTGFQCGLKEAEAELKTGAIPFRRET